MSDYNVLGARSRKAGADAVIELQENGGTTWTFGANNSGSSFIFKRGATTVWTLTASGVTLATGGFTVTAGGMVLTAGVFSVDDTTDTTSTITGSIHTDGGVGIAKALWVGTTSRFVGAVTLDAALVGDLGTDSTSITTGAFQTDGGLGVVKKAYIGTGLTVDTGGIALKAGRISEVLTIVDDDSQSMTLAAADVLAGINVHTSTSGAGTITTDTAANLISGIPLTHDGQCVVSYYINDGDQTCTFTAGDGNIVISDTGNTVLINGSAILLWQRLTSSTMKLHIIS